MNKTIYAVIPARGGSKGIPDKNIVDLGGHPLIAWTIAVANESKYIHSVFVSTDSPKIAEVSQRYHAEIINRPPALATDESTDLGWVRHAIKWFETEGVATQVPDLLIHLRPTTPLRDVHTIDEAIAEFMQVPAATSMRSANQLEESPYKMFVEDNGFYKPFLQGEGEFYNRPRQEFPHVYAPNGYIDILRPAHILQHNNLHGDSIMAYKTKKVTEVDSPDNLIELQNYYYKCPTYHLLAKHV